MCATSTRPAIADSRHAHWQVRHLGPVVQGLPVRRRSMVRGNTWSRRPDLPQRPAPLQKPWARPLRSRPEGDHHPSVRPATNAGAGHHRRGCQWPHDHPTQRSGSISPNRSAPAPPAGDGSQPDREYRRPTRDELLVSRLGIALVVGAFTRDRNAVGVAFAHCGR